MSLATKPRLLCLLCQYRTFSTSYRRLAEPVTKIKAAAATTAATTTKPVGSKKPATPPTRTPNQPPDLKQVIASSPLKDAPRWYGQRVDKFTPKPLSRPIGIPFPPEPGQNTGIDHRTLKQRRDDFFDNEKIKSKRSALKENWSRPYFRDWSNLQHHNGKTFIAPPGLFKADLSLYFPNLYGRTLLKTDKNPRDTTPVLQGKVSIVTLFSGSWAENQANTFVSAKSNPELRRALEANEEAAQLVRVNLEDDWFKATMIKLFMFNIRRQLGEPDWGRYFLVRRAVSDEIRERIGLLNGKVGYVYLLDAECRIRWAGSGQSEDHEREGLVKGLQRLVEEQKKKKNNLPGSQPPSPVPNV